MKTTLHTHDGKEWVMIGTLTDIGGELGSDKLDFSLHELEYHISRLSTTCPLPYRLRHSHARVERDRLYEFDAVLAGYDDGVLTLKFTSEVTGPTRWVE